jgi:hypothetical protein
MCVLEWKNSISLTVHLSIPPGKLYTGEVSGVRQRFLGKNPISKCSFDALREFGFSGL